MNRDPWQTGCIIVFVSVLLGCANSPGLNTFKIELLKGAKWRSDTLHFDSHLAGYCLSGGIGTIKLTPNSGVHCDRLCLQIWTSPGMPPNLESFTLTWGDTLIRASAFGDSSMSEVIAKNTEGRWKTVSQAETRNYFSFQRGDSSVTVCLLPAALGLIKRECTISWIDWYR
jgi:hypothetical protein